MNKLFLIKNPELFQGVKFLETDKNYFEGWYFKNTNKYNGISFIPGISITNGDKRAFIQVITNDSSYFVDYDIDEFIFSYEPFYIKIGDNYFSKDSIHINIKDDSQGLVVHGDVRYFDGINIGTNSFSPNIMGPFSYIPFMECNHAIICMKNKINGIISINNKKIVFNNDIGYIEKDWGISFPKTYIWCQGNEFKNNNTSFMLSVADIPFKIFSFRGVICSLIIDGKEYRFATYNNAKLVRYDVDDDSINIILKRGKYLLYIKSQSNEGLKLIAPVKGEMKKDIFESITDVVNVTLKKKKKTLFSDTSRNCGLEIVNK